MRPSSSGWAYRESAASPRWPAGASGSWGCFAGVKSLGPPYVFCSLRTAYQVQPLFHDYPGHTMYILGRCRRAVDAAAVARRLRSRSDLSVFTRDEFSARTPDLLDHAHRGRQRNGLHSLAQPACRPGGYQSDVIRSDGRVAARTRRAPRPGNSALRMAGLVMAQSLWVGLAGIARWPFP